MISENEQLDIRNFANGLYFLELEGGKTMKFIKN